MVKTITQKQKESKVAKVNVAQLETILERLETARNIIGSRIACMDEETQKYHREAKGKLELAIEAIHDAIYVESKLVEEE